MPNLDVLGFSRWDWSRKTEVRRAWTPRIARGDNIFWSVNIANSGVSEGRTG